jgi:transposase InsO family protein
METFNTLFEAKVLIDDWRLEYNHYRPHMSLDYQTPAAFARQWRHEHQRRLS